MLLGATETDGIQGSTAAVPVLGMGWVIDPVVRATNEKGGHVLCGF